MDKLAFIMSVQRSGSNWLHRCLDHHQDITVCGEMGPSRMLALMSKFRAGDREAQAMLVEQGYDLSIPREAVTTLIRANAGNNNSRLLIDKSAYSAAISHRRYPDKPAYVALLNKYFPDEKKILLVRDARDVVVSFSEWDGQPLGSLLKLTPMSIFRFVRQIRNWCVMHEAWLEGVGENPNWHIVLYENLKTDFSKQIEGVYQFLGFPVTPEFVEEVEDAFYRIDSPRYLQENASRGYGFFRKGGVGEWREKFTLLHRFIYGIAFKGRVNRIYRKISQTSAFEQ